MLEVKYDEYDNRYYEIPGDMVSGGECIRVWIPEGRAPYPFTITKGADTGSILACLNHNGLKLLTQILVEVR